VGGDFPGEGRHDTQLRGCPPAIGLLLYAAALSAMPPLAGEGLGLRGAQLALRKQSIVGVRRQPPQLNRDLSLPK